MSAAIIQYTTISQFNPIWSEEGNLALKSVGIFRPQLPNSPGAAFLGDYAQGNTNPAQGSVLVVAGVLNDDPAKPALKPPVKFQKAWSYQIIQATPVRPGIFSRKNVGSKVLWYPVPPDGYVSCGWVASVINVPDQFPEPTLPTFRCVHRDFCNVVSIPDANFVWNDRFSGNPVDVSLWRVPGLFTMVGNNDEVNPPSPVWAPNNVPQ